MSLSPWVSAVADRTASVPQLPGGCGAGGISTIVPALTSWDSERVLCPLPRAHSVWCLHAAMAIMLWSCGTGFVCGNGIVEPGEACEAGLCCDNCQLAPLFTVCRQPVHACDHPETCTGSSRLCPPVR